MMKSSKIYNKIINSLSYYLDKPSAFRFFTFYTNDWILKTKISKQLAKDLNGTYIDLLKDNLLNLSPKLGIYSPIDFKNDIIKWTKLYENIIVIDEIDPILDTWDKELQKSFFKMISTYRPDSIILISTFINLPYEQLLEEKRIFRFEV